ncbi:MAG TPA: sigma-54-dependent Fis family transcriptional regulator [Patescibacteria group bacterium]|nr:sigma-54-dependent Fis family transcriptional regulator [Patescibacteria group bacterium]
MWIRNMMSTPAILVEETATLPEALTLLAANGAAGLAVTDAQGVLSGLLTADSLLQALALGRGERVAEVMTTPVFALRGNTTIAEMQRDHMVYRYSFFPVVDENRRPVGFVTRGELLKYFAEKTMLMAEEMQAVLNSVNSGVMAVNAGGTITQFNPAAAAITRLNREHVLGMPVDEVIPNTGLKRVLETGVTELNQKQIIGNNEILTDRSPVVKEGKICGAVGIFRNISDLQSVAAELEDVKKLKSTLESILESLYEGIVVVDKSGLITMMNRAYGEFLEVDPRKVVGHHVAEIIPNTRMHIVAMTGKEEIADIQQIISHNTTHNAVVTRIPIVRDGEVSGAVGKMMFKDVKDLKLLSGKINQLQTEVEYYKDELRKVLGGKYTIENIVGNSERMQWLKGIVIKAAKGVSTVLVLGESGTGKELFAHAIHNAGNRRNGPFVKINCAAMPENLLESELFGYEEGAFTSAKKGGKPGKFQLADGGSIFLDEIGDMTLAMQAKLLRVLQEREIERVGGTKTIKVDVRVIAATNRDLEEMVDRGTFRQDLYYRLNIITLNIPPLRERRDDLEELCTALLHKINSQTQQGVLGLSPEVRQIFWTHDWPGNVRELENVLERAVNLMDEGEDYITTEHLPLTLRKRIQKNRTETAEAEPGPGNDSHLNGVVGDAEKQAICRALETAGGNRSRAAQMLGIHRSGLYQKLRKYGIE